MFKKIWFAIFAFSTAYSLYTEENLPLLKINEPTAEEKNHFRYVSFGTYVIVPTVGLGIRTQKGGQGNDFSFSYSYFPEMVPSSLGVQYSRLFYLKHNPQKEFYLGLTAAVNYTRFILFNTHSVLFASGGGMLGYQFKTKDHTHFIELKGNIPLIYSEHGDIDLVLGIPLPSLSYGVSF